MPNYLGEWVSYMRCLYILDGLFGVKIKKQQADWAPLSDLCIIKKLPNPPPPPPLPHQPFTAHIV